MAALLVCFLIQSAPLALAQILYGALVGTVKDASGAAVPGAKIVISNKQTGLVRETVSNNCFIVNPSSAQRSFTCRNSGSEISIVVFTI